MDKCKTALLHRWLQAAMETKDAFVDALMVLGETDIADKIQDK